MELVDQIKIIYRKIFTVKFLPEGYTGVNQDFISGNISVKPDATTKQLFANHKMLYRFYNDCLICFIQCDIIPVPGDEPKNLPHINFTGEDVRIRFLMNASTAFLERTDITAAGARHVYQFSNQSNAGTNHVITANGDGVNDDDLKEIGLVDPDETCFAVLDIHTMNTMNIGYAIFDSAQRLVDNQPEYKIIFNSAV